MIIHEWLFGCKRNKKKTFKKTEIVWKKRQFVLRIRRRRRKFILFFGLFRRLPTTILYNKVNVNKIFFFILYVIFMDIHTIAIYWKRTTSEFWFAKQVIILYNVPWMMVTVELYTHSVCYWDRYTQVKSKKYTFFFG